MCSASRTQQALIVEAITGLRPKLPFPLLGLDTDNNSPFMNDTLWNYCQEHGIVFTRSRAYRKNDQAWVEQKNGAIVRKLIGYGRLQGLRLDRLPGSRDESIPPSQQKCGPQPSYECGLSHRVSSYALHRLVP